MRIVFAIPRYWPAVSSSGSILDHICRYCNQSSPHTARILTAQWEEHWPTELTVREVSVTRFPLQSWGLLPRKTLGGRIADWLQQHRDQWDLLVIVGNIEGGEELFSTAKRLKKPCVIHVMETGAATVWEDAEIQRRHHKRLQQWYRQPHWIVPDLPMKSRVQRQHSTTEVDIWNLGMDYHESDGQLPNETKLALTSAHPILRGSRFVPILVFDGSYDIPETTQWLWQLVRNVFRNRADLRIWLCGDGPGLMNLYHAVNADGLEDLVLFPGYFSSKEDLYRAADLVLLPECGRHTSYDLMTAASVGTPVLHAGQPPIQQVVGSASLGHSIPVPEQGSFASRSVPAEVALAVQDMYPTGQVTEWVSAIFRFLDEPEAWETRFHWVADTLSDKLPRDSTLEEYFQLLTRIGES